jgi:putative IMPACT (imprinted ancient) family translation regulator
MIEKFDLQKVTLIVIRYFGGKKLGIGRLKKAYRECARQVIDSATIEKQMNYLEFNVSYPFQLTNKVQHLAHKYRAIIHEESNSDGMTAKIEVVPSLIIPLKNELMEKASGKVEFKNRYLKM